MLARSAGAEADRRGVMAWRSDVLNDPDLEEDRLAVRRAIADERRAYTPTAADLAADGHARRFLAGLP
jgi:hypothetical protein